MKDMEIPSITAKREKIEAYWKTNTYIDRYTKGDFINENFHTH